MKSTNVHIRTDKNSESVLYSTQLNTGENHLINCQMLDIHDNFIIAQTLRFLQMAPNVGQIYQLKKRDF